MGNENMKINRDQKSKKPLLILACILLLILSVTLAYMYISRQPDGTSNNTVTTETKSLDSTKKSDAEQVQNPQNNPSTKQQTSNTDSPTPPPASGIKKQQIPIVVSTNIASGSVYIRGGINFRDADGSCFAMLSGPSGQSIRKDTVTLQNPASTDCKTISIPSSELSARDWSVKLYYSSNNYEGASDAVKFSL